MPLYDYICLNCHEEYEMRHGMSEEAHPCPYCGSLQVQKCIGFLRVNSLRGSDSDLERLAREESQKPEFAEKKRVRKLLNQMKPTPDNMFRDQDSCIEHTRQELEERYGKIFPEERPSSKAKTTKAPVHNCTKGCNHA